MNRESTSSPPKRPSEEEDDESNPLKRGHLSYSASSLGPPQSNRSAKSYLTAAFSDKIKRQVKSLYGDRCWVCKAFPAEAAHIINRTDDQFELLKELGVVHFHTLGHESNAILLCPLCHVQFDRPNPGLVIVPSDLPWFVEWELRDRERRVTEYRVTGTLPQRISPTAEDYEKHSHTANGAGVSAAYSQYIRVDYFSVFGNRQPLTGLIGTTSWHGSPTAMIRKALVAAAMPTGLPYHVVSSLDELKMLWFVRDVALECGTDAAKDADLNPGLPDPAEKSDGHPPSHKPGGPSDTGQSSHGNNPATTNTNPGRSHSLPLSAVYSGLVTPLPHWRPLVPSPHTTDSGQTEDGRLAHQIHHKLPGNPHGWKWGPMASTQKAMDYYTMQLGSDCT
ncbi:hypothetical protein Q9L58_008332 [Maublancomyces gigas]|uniref:HNH nuclease domain-containing protein n=1 Tax=Discina gigas TaxID=1032678 RepID=A0ABR3GA02_9PEZI